MPKEQSKEYQKHYRKEHEEEYKEYKKHYRKTNKDLIKAKDRLYNKTIKGRFAQVKKGAKKRNVDLNLTIEQYETIVTMGRCHYCGQTLSETGGGIDRKDNKIGYVVENIVTCCYRCNTTFMSHYSYKEKLILAEAIKDIDLLRSIV